MAPRAKRRKIQAPNTSSTTRHEDTCDQHDDADHVETTCNAIKADQTRYGNKIKAKAAVASDYLPVCRTHHKQSEDILRQHCRATATCGRPCQRVCVASKSLDHVCDEHVDVEFPCYIKKLPTELLLMVAAHFIPSGHVKGRHQSNATARALLLVNKEFTEKIGTELFQSKRRRLPVRCQDAEISVRDYYFKEELEMSPYDHARRPLERLYELGLHQFKYVNLDIRFSNPHQVDLFLQQIMESIRHVLSALKLVKDAGYDAKRKSHSKVSCKQLRVFLTIPARAYDLPSGKEMLAIINSIFEVFRYHYRGMLSKLQFTVKIVGDVKAVLKPGRLNIHRVRDSRYEELIPRLKDFAQALMFRRWLQPSTAHQESATRSWILFLKYKALCKDLIDAGLFNEGKKRGQHSVVVLDNEREALSNRDEASLLQIINATWSYYQKRKVAFQRVDKLLEDWHGGVEADGEIGDYIKALDVPAPVLYMTSHFSTVKQGLADLKFSLKNTVPTQCGVFRTGLRETSRVYRLVTPRVIRDLHILGIGGEELTEKAEENPAEDTTVTQTKLMWQKSTRKLTWAKE